ncbi:hypothetical protein ACFWBB_10455 [Streptomyces sp. NPDC060000]|uniref:hypothetical protein n=1 Tax=Streptomyces sp. NPDC060000 TaxID=3347031 RepID=UPI00369E9AEE
MTIRRTLQRVTVAAVLVPASLGALASPARAAQLPSACQTTIAEFQDKLPVQQFTVPDKVKSTLLQELLMLSETDQQKFTETACSAWNQWATANATAVAKDLDTRYQNTDGLVCQKFVTATIGTLKKYSPSIPAATRPLETVAKKVWSNAMQKLSADASNTSCQQSYNNVKVGW